MSFRIVMSLVVIAVLCALFMITQGSTSTAPSSETPAPSSDDRALKSLNLN